MAEKTIPPSPNWYLSSASDANESGVYVYAARMNVYVFDISVPTLGPRMLRCYSGHTERVTSVALSPIGAAVAPRQASQQPGSTGNSEEADWREAGASCGQVSADVADGVLCCSGGDDKVVKIWAVDRLLDVESHSEHKEKVTSVCWSTVNSNLVASGDEKGEVILWNRKANTVSKWRQEKNHIYCMAFCPHEPALLAVGMRVGTVYLVDFSSSAGYLVHRLRGHDDEVLSLSWCPVPGEHVLKEPENEGNKLEDVDKDRDGCLIATGSKDRTIRVWSRSQGRQLFVKKLPNQKRDFHEPGAGRLKGWVAVHWLKSNPENLVSSSSGGDLLMWNLRYTKGPAYRAFYCREFQSHYRPIFNIVASGPSGETLCTYAQERNVLLWSVGTEEAVASLPTLGGHVYCIRNSPIDPGRVAIGVGDAMIRVWNMSSKTNPTDVSNLRQGIKSKVTALAWHPEKEGLLGFGTEDGRVGVYDVLSNKMPAMSGTFHHRTVYVVGWGPPLAEAGDGKNYSLYSVGDCKILEHPRSALSRGDNKAGAVDMTEKVETVNGDQLTALKATELSWNLEVGVAALGADDGSVYIISAVGLKLLATIKIHKKLMNCVRWHPGATDESPGGSPYRNWLVSGGNDQVLHVVDVSSVLSPRDRATEGAVITSSLREFIGHSQRVTDVCWSSHHDGRMVSVGYDEEAFVWDVKKGVALAQFKGHWGRILTCQFSGLDPDLVLTGGSDSAVMVWRVSQQPGPEFGERKRRKRKPDHAKTAAASAANTTVPQVVTVSEDSDRANSGTTDDRMAAAADTEDAMGGRDEDLADVQHHLQDLLAAKRRDLLAAQGDLDVSDGVNGRRVVSYDDVIGDAEPVPSVRGSDAPEDPQDPADDEQHRKEGSRSASGAEGASSGRSGVVVVVGGGGGHSSRGGGGGLRLVKGDLEAGGGGRKKRKTKSYFPVAAQAENKGRAATYDDLRLLTRLQFGTENRQENNEGEETEVSGRNPPSDRQHIGVCTDRKGSGLSPQEQEAARSSSGKISQGEETGVSGKNLSLDKHHLGIFTDRKGTYLSLQQEVSHHASHDNMEYALQMELWKGNIAGAIQLARERAQLSDWIVSLAPLASYETWLTLCEEYAEQLEEEGLYHKAVSYLLACHKLYPAIDLFKRHRLFREAVALARVRLSPLDPVLEDLYTEWSEQLMRDGAYEQAAKCYLAMKQIQDAAQVIARRNDQASLQAACHITLVGSDKQQGQLYAQQVVTRYLLNHQWTQCLHFLSEHHQLKVFLPYASVHEMLTRELMTLLPDLVPTEECRAAATWDTTPGDKLGIPEFILDPKEADPVLPWEPYLVAGHTFPHHVLRVWHLHLGVTMETEQLHLVYHALHQLQSGRQAHLNIQQALLQVGADVTLWLLALLTNQTSLAISHLLGALSALHEGGHHGLLTALCRLILPQGPKYTLKLQQEVAALRVLINMESQVEVEGGGKHLSLRRYLSQLKDEPSVSTGALRCKPLDCVRAYYYTSVLHYLQDSYSTRSQDACRPELRPTSTTTTTPTTSPATTTTASSTTIASHPEGPEKGSTGKSTAGLDSKTSGPVGFGLEETKGAADDSATTTTTTPSSALPQPGAPAARAGGGGGGEGGNAPAPSTLSPTTSDKKPARRGDEDGGTPASAAKPQTKATPSDEDARTPPSSSAASRDGDGDGGSSVDLPQVGRHPPGDGGEAGRRGSSPPSGGKKSTPSPSPPAGAGDSPGGEGSRAGLGSPPGGDARTAKSGALEPGSSVSPTSSTSSSPSSAAAVVQDVGSGSGHGDVAPLTTASRGSSSSAAAAVAAAVASSSSWRLTLQRLLLLSKGLLWDVQAKRLALTDTLGYIHHAISQHLLTDRSREAARTLVRHPLLSGGGGGGAGGGGGGGGLSHHHLLRHHHHHHQHHAPHQHQLQQQHHHHHIPSNASSFAPPLADTVAAHVPAEPLLDIDEDVVDVVGGGGSLVGGPPPAAESAGKGAGGGGVGGGGGVEVEKDSSGASGVAVSSGGGGGAVLLTSSSPPSLPGLSLSSSSSSSPSSTSSSSSSSSSARPSSAAPASDHHLLLPPPPPLPAVPERSRSKGSAGDLADHHLGLDPMDALPESNFDLDLATLGQQWDGSRRVLWQDDPVTASGRGVALEGGRHGNSGALLAGGGIGGGSGSGGGDSSLHKPTSLLSGGKYINVPDEWYSLPVDEKYAGSYVTLAILKDEQDFVMGELKRMSDSSQVPFPNPFHGVELLLSVCLASDSQLMSDVDKHDYIKDLQSWAMHFAVTSRQRSKVDALFTSAEKEIEL